MSLRSPKVDRAYAQSRYGQLHYRIARPESTPTRPTLVCFHQSPKSGWDYEPLMATLARDRVVLAPDTPGYGGSDAPPAPTTIEDYAAVLRAFVEDLQAKGEIPSGPVDVLGYHTGAVICTELGRSWPEGVRRICLLGLAAYDDAERAKRLAAIDRFPVPQADGSNITALWTLVETLNDPRIDIEWRQLSFAECQRAGSRLPWGFIAVYKYDFLGNLAVLAQPTLILCPEDDLWENTHKVAPIIPNGRLLEFPGAAHGFFKLDRDHVVAELRTFLDGAAA
jgi:pimeloyl-ACP methyl ester carboxylesterase